MKQKKRLKRQIFKGCILDVNIIDVAIPSLNETSSTFFLIEDQNKDIQRMAVYKLGKDFVKINEKLPFGCKLKIMNPYFRLAADGKPMIRVDDPQTLIPYKYNEDRCRLCGIENCKLSCSKCKVAKYCSKECQTIDWKTLHHKYICK